jgi:hypothetical protein
MFKKKAILLDIRHLAALEQLKDGGVEGGRVGGGGVSRGIHARKQKLNLGDGVGKLCLLVSNIRRAHFFKGVVKEFILL